MTLQDWLYSNILFIVQLVILGFQIFFSVKTDRKRLDFEKFIELSKQASIKIEPYVDMSLQETILLTNIGNSSIDEIVVSLFLTIYQKGKTETSNKIEWENKTVLNPTEKATIRIFEKLCPILEDNKLIKKIVFEVPTNMHDYYGEPIMYQEEKKHIRNKFDIKLSVEVKPKVFETIKSINKTFMLSYYFREEAYETPPNDFRYEDNYEIKITELFGSWKS